MKITARQYAQSLYESVSAKSEKEAKLVLQNFVALLGRNRELNKAEEIIRIFAEIWNKAQGELNAELISARELEASAREMIVSYLKEKTDAKKINLQEEIDNKLLGGFVLKYDSRVLDGSLKTSLEELKNKINS